MSMSSMTQSPWVRYVLIFLLAVVLVYAVLYVAHLPSLKASEYFTSQEMGLAAVKYNIVYMYSNTCPHCKDMEPTWNQCVEQNNAGNVMFRKIEKNDEDALQYATHVSGYPTVLVLDQSGNLVNTQVGRTNLADLMNFVTPYL